MTGGSVGEPGGPGGPGIAGGIAGRPFHHTRIAGRIMRALIILGWSSYLLGLVTLILGSTLSVPQGLGAAVRILLAVGVFGALTFSLLAALAWVYWVRISVEPGLKKVIMLAFAVAPSIVTVAMWTLLVLMSIPVAQL